jgi:integrase/recombinase XerC
MPYITAFCNYISHQKRYSQHTVTAYKTDLEQFNQFLLSDFQIDSFKEADSSTIRSWIVHLIENSISPRSINRKISTLKSFYKYMLKNKEVNNNPLLKVVTPKTSKRLPVFVGENEISNLFSEVKYQDNYEGSRDKLILEFLYATGIRLIELVNLEINSIDFNNATIKVIGKRNKERIIPFGDKLRKEISEYLVERQKLKPSVNQLFLTKSGKKIYQKLVYRTVNYYLSMVTTASKKSPHVLRHTFATHMLNNGADLNSIKEILGHANLSATQVYTHNTIEKLKNIHNQAHPKA